MRRRHISAGIAELQSLFQAAQDHAAALEELRSELSHRSTRGARDLFAQVVARLDELRTGAPSARASTGDTISDDLEDGEQEAEDDSGDGSLHPDDQRKPANLTRIRPPGTAGLPDVWQRTLRQDLSLQVTADSDLPELYVSAVSALVTEIKRSGANQKRYELEKGERQEATNDDILYAFPFADEADLFEEAQVELQVGGRRVEGSIVSISAGRLVVALKEELGDEIRKAVLIVDTTALLAALVTKIEQVKKGEVTLNRELADAIAGRKTTPATPPRIAARASTSLNQAQRAAFEQAARSAVTWIWGPPGCGKTKTLGDIVRAGFEAGDRLLVCSNTNKAVDQVLHSICETLGTEHTAMQEGRVVRLGRIADNKLNDYAAYVTVNGIVERRTKELHERREQIERTIELLDARTIKSRRLLSRFTDLDHAEAVAGAARDALSKLAADAETALRSKQRNSARQIELQTELEKRRKAFIGLLSRSEEVIQKDIDANGAQRLAIVTEMASLKVKCEGAKAQFDAAAADYDEKRRALAGEDRAVAEGAVKDAAEQRSDFVSELREIDAKIAAIRETVIKEARILGATCTKAYLSVKDVGQVDTVVIDEASMVLLPVAWFAAGLAKQRVIVCGDFRQIPPIVQSDQEAIVTVVGNDAFTANSLGPGDDRLMMLNTQYRMHDSICQLVADPMYDGRLTTATDRRDEAGGVPDPFNQPLTIIDTSDLWPLESQNPFFSRFNLMHALLARNIAFHFAKAGVVQDREALGICTPYAAQAKIIGKLLEGEELRELVQVGTVHSYQGDERATMLLDIPESHGGAWNIGQFLQGIAPSHVGARLMNVAVSRAQHRLIVIANLTYLDRKLPSSSLLRSILHNMQECGHVVRGSDALALRPIDRDLKGLLGLMPFESMVETFGLFDEQSFERALEHDVREAKVSVVIFSGYVTPTRVGKLGDLFRSKIADGVRIRCVTRPPQTNGSIPQEQGREALNMLEGIGVTVDCRAKIHQKVCLIDNRIVWLGSLNALSHAGRSDETMTRAVNEGYAAAVAGHMSKRRVSTEKAASSVTDAENPRCPTCSSRTVYNDGRFGPYFSCEAQCGWRANERSVNNGAMHPGANPDVEPLPKHGPTCPKCGSKTGLRSGRRGRFYGCTKYPACDGTADPA